MSDQFDTDPQSSVNGQPAIIRPVDAAGNAYSPSNPIPVSSSPSTLTSATLANKTAAATSATIFASNAAARSRIIFNDADKALYLKFGATASATSFTVKIAAGGYYELPAPLYTGIVDGIWETGPTGAARTTEA